MRLRSCFFKVKIFFGLKNQIRNKQFSLLKIKKLKKKLKVDVHFLFFDIDSFENLFLNKSLKIRK